MATESKIPEDDLEVIVDGDDTAADGKPAAAAAPSADDAIAKLTRDLESERNGRIAAESRASNAESHLAAAGGEVHTSNLALITNAIETVKQDNNLLKRQLSEARAAGDIDAEFDINARVAENASKLVQLNQGKSALEQQQPVQRRTEPSDEVEALAAKLAPRSAAWVRAHPEVAKDPRKYNKMLAAHHAALADGLTAETSEYFAAVEKTMGYSNDTASTASAEAPTGDTAAQASGGRSAAPAAAPVSRGGGGTGSRPQVVRLTKEEREMAANMGQTPQEYAANKLALQREGKLS
jgi:hypothetical protein